jgi:2-phosphoglycerate kinase
MNIDVLKEKLKTKKIVILLGGTSGTGKTTLGNRLLSTLGLDHSVGTGWIREVAKQNLSKEEFPALFGFTFEPFREGLTVFESFSHGAKDLQPYVDACIKRARREGTSLLIEGAHLTPGVVSKEMYDFFFVLEQPKELEDYHRIITGSTHANRTITSDNLKANRQIQSGLFRVAQEHRVDVVPFGSLEERETFILKQIMSKFVK